MSQNIRLKKIDEINKKLFAWRNWGGGSTKMFIQV